MTFEINLDHDLANADWAKRTPDTMEALKAGAGESKESQSDDGDEKKSKPR